jgi:hypothetical protein
LPAERPFSAFAVRRKRAGEIDFWELEFTIVTASDGRRSLGAPEVKSHLTDEIPRGPFVFYISHAVPKELTDSLEADVPDNIVLRKIDKVFDAVRASSATARNEIGGPVDVASIDADGLRWLRRKPIFL